MSDSNTDIRFWDGFSMPVHAARAAGPRQSHFDDRDWIYTICFEVGILVAAGRSTWCMGSDMPLYLQTILVTRMHVPGSRQVNSSDLSLSMLPQCAGTQSWQMLYYLYNQSPNSLQQRLPVSIDGKVIDGRTLSYLLNQIEPGPIWIDTVYYPYKACLLSGFDWLAILPLLTVPPIATITIAR
jgi:hypothetical protein